MVYNIDEVMLYLPYYLVGYVTFPYIRDLLSKPTEKKLNLFVIMISGTVCFLYSTAIFFGIDPLAGLWQIQYIGQVLFMIRPLIIIWAVVILSYLLRNVVLLQELGKGTLYICGNESTAKIIVSAALGLLGLTIAPQNPLQVFIYSAFLMILINCALKPVEEKWMHFIQSLLDKLLSRLHVIVY